MGWVSLRAATETVPSGAPWRASSRATASARSTEILKFTILWRTGSMLRVRALAWPITCSLPPRSRCTATTSRNTRRAVESRLAFPLSKRMVATLSPRPAEIPVEKLEETGTAGAMTGRGGAASALIDAASVPDRGSTPCDDTTMDSMAPALPPKTELAGAAPAAPVGTPCARRAR